MDYKTEKIVVQIAKIIKGEEFDGIDYDDAVKVLAVLEERDARIHKILDEEEKRLEAKGDVLSMFDEGSIATVRKIREMI